MDKRFTLEVVGGDPESDCAGKHCPAIYRGSDGEFYIQGYIVPGEVRAAAQRSPDEDIVRITHELIEAMKKL